MVDQFICDWGDTLMMITTNQLLHEVPDVAGPPEEDQTAVDEHDGDGQPRLVCLVCRRRKADGSRLW